MGFKQSKHNNLFFCQLMYLHTSMASAHAQEKNLSRGNDAHRVSCKHTQQNKSLEHHSPDAHKVDFLEQAETLGATVCKGSRISVITCSMFEVLRRLFHADSRRRIGDVSILILVYFCVCLIDTDLLSMMPAHMFVLDFQSPRCY